MFRYAGEDISNEDLMVLQRQWEKLSAALQEIVGNALDLSDSFSKVSQGLSDRSFLKLKIGMHTIVKEVYALSKKTNGLSEKVYDKVRDTLNGFLREVARAANRKMEQPRREERKMVAGSTGFRLLAVYRRLTKLAVAHRKLGL